jgi:hypothetical protein
MPPQQYTQEGHTEISKRNRPHAQRVDTDPSQQQAWQNESSVRHVLPQHSGQGYLGGENLANSQTQWSNSAPNSPYHHRVGSSESQVSTGSGGRRRQNFQSQQRSSTWGKSQNNASGGLGVPGF